MATKIEWTDEVWNPVTGCTKVSQGCKNCYAETIAKRFWGERKFTDVQCHMDRLGIPSRWKKPRLVFVNSMSDLFHEDVSFDFILHCWMVMAGTKHIYQVLTKRPERMHRFVNEWLPGAWGLATMSMELLDYPIPNIWLGVSVENQETADERIPWLLKTPAAIRFVSYEPALGPVNLGNVLGRYLANKLGNWIENPDGGIDWVIAGCESGRGARPAHRDWFRFIRDQCQEVDIPFFLKQMVVNGKLTKMPELDDRVWNEYPGGSGE